MKITTDLSFVLGVVMALAFLVNIIVQITKGFVPVPTKMWCVLVSVTVIMALLFAGTSIGILKINTGYIVLSLVGSFIISFIAMYGFDTFKELWQRFKDGENINEDN